MLVVLLILAVALDWGIAWKIIIGVCAVYILVMIAWEFWKNKK